MYNQYVVNMWIILMNKIDNYKYDNKDYLGKGSFGKVYKGIMIDKNKEVAIKSKKLSTI